MKWYYYSDSNRKYLFKHHTRLPLIELFTPSTFCLMNGMAMMTKKTMKMSMFLTSNVVYTYLVKK